MRGPRRIVQDFGGQPHAEQTLVFLVTASGPGLIGNGVRAVLTGSDAAPDAVAALRTFAGARYFSFERSSSGLALGADALTLGLFRLAIGFSLGVFGLLLFVLQPLGLVACGVALGDLLQALGFLFLTDALALGFFRRECGGAGGLLLGFFARLFFFALFELEGLGLLALLQLARFFFFALFELALFFFGLERLFTLRLFAGALGLLG